MTPPLSKIDLPTPPQFRAFALKMEEMGMPSIVINVFKNYYSQLVNGAHGKLSEEEILPLGPKDVVEYSILGSYAESGEKALPKAVIIKLNGGLGTSMGLEKAKSLIQVREGLTFLDLIIKQTLYIRQKYSVELPLILMNSFKTHFDTMTSIEAFDNGSTGIPVSFVQHRYPKVLAKDFSPAFWPNNTELEWNPPGHGDIYTALITSKLLSKLLKKGFRFAFISNSDNLGAVMDKNILGYMTQNEIPFVMEVAKRTSADSKGGHLAILKDSKRFVLREIAQCPDDELEDFSDIKKYQYFNTNSIWLNLKEMERVFIKNKMMPLDLIVNPKTLDPRDSMSPRVVQLETAMGSAISNFSNAGVVLVPRTRFAPVKTTSDLLLLMSDLYEITPEQTVVQKQERLLPLIHLDDHFYKKIDDFFSRFPHGAPSLAECTSLEIKGDIRFGANCVCKGDVKLKNQRPFQKVIADGTELTGKMKF